MDATYLFANSELPYTQCHENIFLNSHFLSAHRFHICHSLNILSFLQIENNTHRIFRAAQQITSKCQSSTKCKTMPACCFSISAGRFVRHFISLKLTFSKSSGISPERKQFSRLFFRCCKSSKHLSHWLSRMLHRSI